MSGLHYGCAALPWAVHSVHPGAVKSRREGVDVGNESSVATISRSAVTTERLQGLALGGHGFRSSAAQNKCWIGVAVCAELSIS